mmetsp:Transcript_16759/g.24310  ORF Transcript_16759/g.24310 Transcript_16759/m.24310 type:complete len:254 (-) Transcript_16759:28-789(-)
MRRKVGVSAVKKKQEETNQYSKVGKTLESNKISAVTEVMSKFRTTLADFAMKHRDRINSDPEFRQQFHSMCVSLGVDPLASSKGFWADLLGVGDFYFELGQKIIEISVQTRSINGGIIPLSTILERLNARAQSQFSSSSSSQSSVITEDDVKRAIEKLVTLSSGYRMIKLSKDNIVITSVPLEVSSDHEQLMSVAHDDGGMVSEVSMREMQGWSSDRFYRIINPLLREGMLWIDDNYGDQRYYFYSMWKDSTG